MSIREVSYATFSSTKKRSRIRCGQQLVSRYGYDAPICNVGARRDMVAYSLHTFSFLFFVIWEIILLTVGEHMEPPQPHSCNMVQPASTAVMFHSDYDGPKSIKLFIKRITGIVVQFHPWSVVRLTCKSRNPAGPVWPLSSGAETWILRRVLSPAWQ